MMWLVLILVVAGFFAGYFLQVPYRAVDTKFVALVFLALLDSLTYALVRDLQALKRNNLPVLTRLLLAVVLGSFIIYFGEKSRIDLYLVALLPLALGFAVNLYKFLPK